MHMPVLGSGVVGVTSVYYLARANHEVVAVDREAGPALETSFANASQTSPGHTSPWTVSGVPLKVIKWMLQQHAPLTIRPNGTLFQLRWIWQMLRNCDTASCAQNKERMVRLAEYSRDYIHDLRADTGIAYEDRQQGMLQIFRTQQQLDGIANDITVFEHVGVLYELLSCEDLIRSEPDLASTHRELAGGLRLPNDETGDCQLFTTRLIVIAEKLGVRFRFNSTINSLISKNDVVHGALVDGQPVDADLVVAALGSYNTLFLKNLVNIPVYPPKGFSITVPTANVMGSPVSTILDGTCKVAVTRSDNRIRMGGMAQTVGYDERPNPSKRKALEFVVNDLFLGARDVSRASS